MKKEQASFIKNLILINKEKTEPNLTEELKEMYRVSIKTGQRKQFIERVRSNIAVVNSINHETFAALGSNMFAVASLVAEYVEFQHWIVKMTGNLGE